jgi:hypothetical protein
LTPLGRAGLELEEAELTDGPGRALSTHKSKVYEGYAKRTEKRALAATRKRYAHRGGGLGGRRGGARPGRFRSGCSTRQLLDSKLLSTYNHNLAKPELCPRAVEAVQDIFGHGWSSRQ